MQRLKLIRSLCLLSALVIGVLPSIVNAQAMSTAVRNIMPTQDPYCGGNYSPLSTVSSLSDADKATLCPTIPAAPLTQIPDHVVDWVLVELRVAVRSGDSADPTAAGGDTVVARKPAFLLTNGRIVDAAEYAALETHDPSVCTALTAHANCPDLVFDQGDVTAALDADSDGTNDHLYLVIRHRNHLDVMSSMPLTDDGESGVYSYNFSDARNKIYNQSNKLKSSVYALLAGDANGDGRISNTDYFTEIQPNSPSANRYLNADANFDARVETSDFYSSVQINSPQVTAVPN